MKAKMNLFCFVLSCTVFFFGVVGINAINDDAINK